MKMFISDLYVINRKFSTAFPIPVSKMLVI